MGGAPVIETIRPGVAFTPAAAASWRRCEYDWGSPIPTNSTYRDYWLQLSMYNAWNAWVNGTGPRPAHSRAIHPDVSVHCRGEAADTDMWTHPGFIEFMADHGWIRTAANDPTERHHFEYQWWRDNHRNRTDDDMPSMNEFLNHPAYDGGPSISQFFKNVDQGGVAAQVWARAVDRGLDANGKQVLIPAIQELADVKTLLLAQRSDAGQVLTDAQVNTIGQQIAAVSVAGIAQALEDDFDGVRDLLAQLPADTIAALKAAL